MYGRPVFAPSGATERPAAPAVSDASVPFGAGVFDGTPVNIPRGEGLDLSSLLNEAAVPPREDDFAALDARDTLAEDLVWTPSPGGQRSIGGSDCGPTISPEGAAEHADESMSDGGGPWSIVRGKKRTTTDRSPLKTPLRPAHGRAKVGEMPAAIKELPNAPNNQRAPAATIPPNGTPGRAIGAQHTHHGPQAAGEDPGQPEGAAFRPHLLLREPLRLRATGRARSRPTLREGRQARHPLAMRRISAVATGITAIMALTTESQSRDGPSSQCSVSVRLPASW